MDCTFRYFTLDALDAAISDPAVDVTGRLHVVGTGPGFERDAAKALSARGITRAGDTNYHWILPRPAQASGPISFDVQFTSMLDSVVKRCMAKIAFNYLAYVAMERLGQTDWLQRPDFDTVREYVRYDGVTRVPPISTDVGIHVKHRESVEPQGHLAAVLWERQTQDVVATVRLFSVFAWQVMLARGFKGIAWPLQSAHFWDLQQWEVSELRAVPKGLLPW